MRRLQTTELALGAGAVVLLAASVAGALGVGDDDTQGGAASGAPGEVAIVDFDFRPATLQVGVGQTVTWTNEDTAAHTVTSDGDGPLDSGDLAQGATYEATFDAAGTYEYICTIHPTMRATVEVAS
jgi:plastocyanin